MISVEITCGKKGVFLPSVRYIQAYLFLIRNDKLNVFTPYLKAYDFYVAKFNTIVRPTSVLEEFIID